MKKKLVALFLFASIVIISFIFRLNFIYILIITTLCIISYYYISTYFHQHEDEKFIEQKLLIANKEIIKAPDTIILIIKDQRIIWCNDLSYSEFPILKATRSLKNNKIKPNTENQFTFNNQIYYVTGNDGLFFIRNITQAAKKDELLKNLQTNIAILNIDNYNYLEEQLARENFASINRDLRIDLLKFFDEHNIFYQENDGERYQLIIPENELTKLLNTRFEDLAKVFSKYQTETYTISYSLGIAYHQKSIRDTGYKAMEALELAISRGGAQTVVFDGDNRKIFGGGMDVIHGSTLLKARLMAQTILNIAKSKRRIFLMGHKNPDCDCIGAMLLAYRMIRSRFDIPITIIVDKQNQEFIKNILIEPKNLTFLEQTINYEDDCLLIIVDTQSQNYIFDETAIDNISDIIVIDHHQAPEDCITNVVTKWTEPSLSSAVEMILQMLSIIQVKLNNKRLATYVLYAMLIDTNYLTYRVNDTTLEMVKRLVNDGGNMIDARRMSFDNFDDFKEINRLASQVHCINKISIVETEDVMDHILLSKVANKILEIKDIIVSCVISKVENQYLVKLRSMGNVNVKLLIEEFGGGGHASQAAGILTYEQKEQLIEKFKTFEAKE